MREKRKKGNPRMAQLTRKKYEVWFYETTAGEVKKFAEALNLPVAKFLRRAARYFIGGGVEFSQLLKNRRYD